MWELATLPRVSLGHSAWPLLGQNSVHAGRTVCLLGSLAFLMAAWLVGVWAMLGCPAHWYSGWPLYDGGTMRVGACLPHRQACPWATLHGRCLVKTRCMQVNRLFARVSGTLDDCSELASDL